MTSTANFQALGLSESTLTALSRKGFEEPTAIQAAAIPLLLDGSKDIIGQAQTGTGKTAAFALPIIELLQGDSKYVRAIVLAPTRELTIQVAEEMNSLKGDSPLAITPIYGGQSIELQLSRLKRGVDVVVGTPGRVMDMMRRGALKLDKVEFAVLDEADEMLNMGFVEDMELILAETNDTKRTLMFSATMPPPIMDIARKFMREFEIIRTQSELTVNNTEQIYFEVRREDKLEALARIIDIEQEFYAMVFCRTKSDVDELVEKLNMRGYDVEGLHGDISQAQRTRTIERFKARRFDVLVATDVAARGIDVNNLTHVINFSIPQQAEAYVHRIGRTGRAGRSGTAITFVTPAEFRTLTRIKREVNIDIRKEAIPDASQVVKTKARQLEHELAQVIAQGGNRVYRELAESMLEDMDASELVTALLHLHCREELLPESYAEIGRSAKRGPVDRRGRARLFIGLGKRDGYGAKKILDFVFERTGLGCQKLGKVDCYDNFSFIDADFADAETIVRAFRREDRNGRPLVEIAKDKNAPQENSARPATGARAPRSTERGERAERSERSAKPAAPPAAEAAADAPPALNRKARRAIMFADKKREKK